MVQYTNILIASAVAAAVPAIAAPFAYLESRDLAKLEAREPVLKATVDLIATGASRRVITGPLRGRIKDAAMQKPIHSGPGLAQEATNKAMDKIKSKNSASEHSKQSALDAQRAIIAAAKEASKPITLPKGAQHPPSKILTELAKHNANQRRSFEYLDIRELEDLLERDYLYLD